MYIFSTFHLHNYPIPTHKLTSALEKTSNLNHHSTGIRVNNVITIAKAESSNIAQGQQSTYEHVVRKTIPPRERRPQRAAASTVRDDIRQIFAESEMPLQRYFVNEIWKNRNAQKAKMPLK